MVESNPIFEFAQLWESTKERASEVGLSLQATEPDRFSLSIGASPVFSSRNLSDCAAFIDGVEWERAPQG